MKKAIRAALPAAFLLLAALLIAGTASASTPGGATVQTGTGSTNATPVSSGSNTSQGGYITEINITGGNQQTSYWQGYYGNVTQGTIYLNDSSGTSMKSWSANIANGGYVYATNKTTAPAWSNLAQIVNTTLDNSSYWNFGSKSDNISKTYNAGPESVTFAGVSVNAYKAVVSVFNNYVITDQSATAKTAIVWAAAISDNAANYKGTSSDYELLVPVAAREVYYFYLEIL